jgi:four helix bundle protein
MKVYNSNSIKDFTDLLVWQEGHELVIMIYQATDNFPKKEIYSLTDQIRRAIVSFTSNIAEGWGRKTAKEKIQFFYQSQGSLIEVKNQLIIAKDVGYLSQESFEKLYSQANCAHKLLQGLITKTKSFIKN